MLLVACNNGLKDGFYLRGDRREANTLASMPMVLVSQDQASVKVYMRCTGMYPWVAFLMGESEWAGGGDPVFCPWR